MEYTIRFCHMEKSYVKKGDVLKFGDKIGKMGSTGQSTHNHVHMDLAQEAISELYHLSDIPDKITDIQELMRQYHFFIDDSLFGVDPVITSSFGDPMYKIRKKWKFHPGYDLVPVNRFKTEKNFDIMWNRSIEGLVVSSELDDAYGNYVNIVFEV